MAKYLLPKLDEAARALGYGELIDTHVEPQKQIGIPDLIAERGGKRLYVVEAKYKKQIGNSQRDIEPRDPEVIKQASRYAFNSGYPCMLLLTTND